MEGVRWGMGQLRPIVGIESYAASLNFMRIRIIRIRTSYGRLQNFLYPTNLPGQPEATPLAEELSGLVRCTAALALKRVSAVINR